MSILFKEMQPSKMKPIDFTNDVISISESEEQPEKDEDRIDFTDYCHFLQRSAQDCLFQ